MGKKYFMPDIAPPLASPAVAVEKYVVIPASRGSIQLSGWLRSDTQRKASCTAAAISLPLMYVRGFLRSAKSPRMMGS